MHDLFPFDAPFGAEPEARGSRYVRPWPVRDRAPRDRAADKAKRAAVLDRLPAPDFAASWLGSDQVVFSITAEQCDRFGSCDWSYDRIAEAAGYSREAVIKSVARLVAAGVLVKQVRAVEGDMHLPNRLTLRVDGPLFAAAVGWLRKWSRWLWRAAKRPAERPAAGPLHPSRDKTVKYLSFLRRFRLWKDVLSSAIGPNDLVAYADWFNPLERQAFR